MGLPWCSWLVCWCSAATLPLSHNCGKSHTCGTNLRHSVVQKSSPHSAHSHTHGPHCQWREQTHMRFIRRSSYCMRQSTVSNRRAPPGHPAMDENHKTSADKTASYHTFTNAHPTALYPAPCAPSQRRPTPSITSMGGHSKATGHTNNENTQHNSRWTNCASHTVQVPLHGPRTSKGEQNN